MHAFNFGQRSFSSMFPVFMVGLVNRLLAAALYLQYRVVSSQQERE